MNIVIIIFIAAISLMSIYSLGHFVSIKNELFLNNSFAEWVIGIIVYFAITFLAFFPFIIIQVSLSYFVVVFFIKEFLIWVFIVYKREEILKNINIKDTLWIIGAAIAITVIYNIGISKIKQHPYATNASWKFYSWGWYEDVLGKFYKLSISEVRDWSISIIVSTGIYASIASIMTNFIRSNGIIERISSLLVALLILTMMSFGVTLSDSLGIYLIFFAMLLGIRLIIYSRRRYGALFGVLSFVIWSMSPNLLATIIIVALVIIIIYTYRVRPKPSLFFVQLIMPLLMIISLEFYSFNSIFSLLLLFISAGSYIFMLTASNNAFMETLNNFLLKYKVIIPTIVFSIALVIMISIISIKPNATNAFNNLLTTTHPFFIFDNMPKSIEIIERVLFAIMVASLLSVGGYWILKKKEFNKEMLFMGFVALTIIIAFNPIFEKTLSISSKYYAQFTYIRVLVLPPLLLASSTKLISAMKNRVH